MSQEIFNRYEKKFRLTSYQYHQLMRALRGQIRPDHRFCNSQGYYSIYNIYYDTPENALIEKSLSHPLFKEKLRLRAYGIPHLEDKVFIEIKKKYEGKVNKRRAELPLSDVYQLLNQGQVKEACQSLIVKEIEYFLIRYPLKPAVFIAYDRQAYHLGDLRITFDQNIRTRRYDLKLDQGDYGTLLLDQDTYLMEVKSEGNLPLYFTRLLSELAIYPVRFSKYGTEYMQYMQNQYEGVEEQCQPYLQVM